MFKHIHHIQKEDAFPFRQKKCVVPCNVLHRWYSRAKLVGALQLTSFIVLHPQSALEAKLAHATP